MLGIPAGFSGFLCDLLSLSWCECCGSGFATYQTTLAASGLGFGIGCIGLRFGYGVGIVLGEELIVD